MAQTEIFGPFFAMMLLTLVVWIYMYIRRIHFLRSNEISSKELAVPGALARVSPAEVSNPSDNLKNLFELPVLFYALCLHLYATAQVDGLHLATASLFVAFGSLHSLVHCTFNRVMVRFCCYLVSALAIWLVLARAALSHWGS